MPRWIPHRFIGALALVLATTSCAAHDLAFEKDESLRIVAPRALQLVAAPLTIRWTGHAAGANAYVVFIDHPPMAPGTSLRDYARTTCKNSTLCPNDTASSLEAWLEQRGIYTSTSTSEAGRFDVPFVPARGESTEKDTRETHEAIVVALGSDGRRLGESAWAVSFRVHQPDFGE